MNGYSGLSHKIEATAIVHENISQHEISDWDFLNIRAEANGQIVVVNDGVVSIKNRRQLVKVPLPIPMALILLILMLK